MPEAPVGHEAAALVEWLRSGARMALPLLGEELARRAAANVPPTPQRDPHPDMTLADAFVVRVYGDFVSVSNELPYAVKQHESLQFEHPNGGRAKFLERPALEMAAEIGSVMGATIVTREAASGRVRARGA